VENSLSKLSPEKKPANLTPWTAPAVFDDYRDRKPEPSPQAVADLEKQAHSKGYEVGRWEGLQAGHAQIEAQVAELNHLLESFVRPFQRLETKVEEELVLLAGAIAEQLVRREITIDPGLLKVAVEEAASVLASTAQQVRCHLHPEDAALVRAGQGEAVPPGDWQIVDDPRLKRGECQVHSTDQLVDATVRARLDELLRGHFELSAAEGGP